MFEQRPLDPTLSDDVLGLRQSFETLQREIGALAFGRIGIGAEHAHQIADHGGGGLVAAGAGADQHQLAHEVGLDRRFVRVIGTVDRYRTGTGFDITPVVGIVRPGFDIQADPREVADVFEVPLEHFLDERNHRIDSRQVGEGENRRDRRYYAMPYGERYIWGVTAGILRNLYERIYAG